MSKLFKSILTILIILNLYNCQSYKDSVVFPDWPEGYNKNYKSEAGYLDVGDAFIHFVYLSANTQKVKDPSKTILWLNGGPGCSSQLGLVSEVGPYMLLQGEKTFSEEENQYAWNNLANMVFFESPPGVGYSYFKDNKQDKNWTDVNTANWNRLALIEFFKLYPELKGDGKGFYIAGESYGGFYIPMLAKEILDKNPASTSDPAYINLSGILVGNGIMSANKTGFEDLETTTQQYFSGHNFYGPLLDVYAGHCLSSDPSPRCQYFNRQAKIQTNQVNPYNIFGYCYPETKASYGHLKNINPYHASSNGAPCSDFAGFQAYFQRDDVKKAMNISENSAPWLAWGSYTPYPDGTISFMSELVQKIPVVIYNGELDAVIPYLLNDHYVDFIVTQMQLKESNPYQQFITPDNKQVGGWWNSYGDNLIYVKIRAAGHQVPGDQPEAAFYMVNATINGGSSIKL